MSLQYVLVSSRQDSTAVDGLGVLEPGETRVFTSEEADSFAYMRGIALPNAKLPEGVELTILVEGRED